MSEPRRIVPDNSVLVEALFGSEKGLRLKRASQFLTAALNRSIICLAPDTLIVEFIKVAFDFRGGKREHSATPDEIDAQIELFLSIKTYGFRTIKKMDLRPTPAMYMVRYSRLSGTIFIRPPGKDAERFRT
jgi:hypothetical protein